MSFAPPDVLRRIDEALERDHPGQPRPWLQGLRVCVRDGQAEVRFPHKLYERFFAPHRQLFESALRQCLPQVVRIAYAPSEWPHPAPGPTPVAPMPLTQCGRADGGPAGHSLPGPEKALEDFFCNRKNAFPLEAVRRIIEHAPGEIFNPLLLYGYSGTGKSHLLKAIGDAYTRRGLRVMAMQAARFCRQADDWSRQPEYFWQCHDALLLDDLQEIVDEPAWQQRLVPLLDHCPPARQIVFALTGSPQTFKSLQSRLLGRLEGGLVTELLEPDLEIRLRYLQETCRQRNLPLSREEQLFLARRCRQFRLLQGMLLKVEAFAEMRQGSLSRGDIENIARTGGTEPFVGHKEIIEEVSRLYALRPEEVLGNGRRPQLVLARQIAMYVCRRRLGLSYPELGRMFGGRDHSTVVHAIKKIRKVMESNKDVQTVVATLEKNAP